MNNILDVKAARHSVAAAARLRIEGALQEMRDIQKKYGVRFKPRIVIEGSQVASAVIVELDPEWHLQLQSQPSLLQSENESATEQ